MYLIDFGYDSFTKGYVLNLIRDRRTSAKLKYGNEINTFTFTNFTAQDFNLFFVVCWHIKEKKSKELTLSFDELKEFMPMKIKNNKKFYEEIVKFGNKLMIIVASKETIDESNQKRNVGKNFLTYAETSEKEKTLSIVVSDMAYDMLFYTNYFTKFDLNEFCSIQNKYTKTLFRLLKQYENVNENPASGLKNIVMEKQEFLEFMNCPEKYMNNMSMYVDRKILIPAIEGLNEDSQSFKKVSYQKIKEGGVIKHFEISFQTIK
ncbi:replication initiation protein [Helicobacter sp. UBA3407]|uniref:replication initiation protein n=1 Tax=Helicobacter sp. UBA3407 TaxID=1946588 RepID=UPI0026230980|nr:replication initiation protein [Helicobacter sp. UBA3407]